MKKMRLLSVILILALLCTCLFACKKDDPTVDPNKPADPNATYTYNTALSVFPTNWNPHVYQTNTDATILDYASIGFYEFDYNDTKDGYKLVPAMASDYPTDVTASYLGQYGIPAHVENTDDAQWRAIRIPLNTNAKYDNGVAIKAADYVESLKLLLNPDASNYRADSVYSGNLKIHNAKAYLYQGQTILDPAVEVYGENITDWSALYFDPSNVVAFDDIFGTTDMNELADYASYFTVDSVDLYTKLMAYCPEGEAVLMTQAIFDDLKALFSANAPLKAYWNWVDTEIGYFTVDKIDYEEMTFDKVGIKADGEDAIILFLDNELSGFYLNYSLTSHWLVYTPLYKQCETITGDVYTNTYGTTADNFVGYGPYKLTYFLKDAEIKFTKNPYYFGLKDAEGNDLYMTTDINIKYVEQASTRLQMFQKGQLDAYGLTAEDMEDYQSSRYTYYTEGDSTWFMAFNPDMDGLKASQDTANAADASKTINKTIITIKEFRMAFCFGLDRAAYALALDPLGGVAKALYGNMIISDPETGTAYRTTPEAKQAIVNFWGLADEIGEGKTYATIDDAIAAIDGYDPVEAKRLLNVAYDKAIAAGLMDADDIVEIVIGIPRASSKYYSNGAEFLKNCYVELAKGTSLEGKLTFKNSGDLGNDFSDFLKDNTVDMLFGVGWTGSALDPYGLIEAYTSDSYQYDPGWDTTTTNLDITLTIGDAAATTYRGTVDAWTKALGGDKNVKFFVVTEGEAAGTGINIDAGTTAENSVRLAILAAIEQIVLEQYDMIPINLDSSAALKGMQIKYYTEEYVFGVGRGGIKYMTYNYSDTDWSNYVAAQGGTLNYTVSE